MKHKIFCLACGLFCSLGLALQFAHAEVDELVTVSVEGTSHAENEGDATREIGAWAMSNVAREQVMELIGTERFQKNKANIETKIVKQASRFIPFMNTGKIKQLPDKTWQMPVELKISTASLRRIVLDNGLLSDSDGPAAILPLIAFTDRTKGVSSRWWLGEEKDEAHQALVQMSHTLHERMQLEFIRQGFYMMNPIGLQSSPLPMNLRLERPTQSELVAITDNFKMSMVARGDVRVTASRTLPGAFDVSAKIQVLQPLSGRAIAEVSRQFTTDTGAMNVVLKAKSATELPELAKDLAAQVLDAWQRGTLNANVMRVTVRGVLTPKQMADFKAGLMKNVHEVKALKDRLFDHGSVTFEAEVLGDATVLSDHLKTLEVQGFQVKLAESNQKSVTIDVKPK